MSNDQTFEVLTESNDTLKKVLAIVRECKETLETKPTYTDTEADCYRLEGAKNLAQWIMDLMNE